MQRLCCYCGQRVPACDQVEVQVGTSLQWAHRRCTELPRDEFLADDTLRWVDSDHPDFGEDRR